jgi:uroporphyrin-III C-methyltransferase/precorrin-2 dehydrogenase/sirohydrochlorin ferrochelatase
MRRRDRAGARYLPLAIDVHGLPCLVVGGGRVGTRRALKLAAAGAHVTVVAPDISVRLRRHAREGHVDWRPGGYDVGMLNGFILVVAATADRELNRRIRLDADARGVLCCVVSPGRLSRFIFPAAYHDGQLTVAVHSDGRDCRLSQRVRDRIASQWHRLRDRLAACKPSGRQPRPRPLGPPPAPDARGSAPAPPPTPDARGSTPARLGTGKVYIVGAGPGAPDLITVRAREALRSADVVLADRLVPSTFLEQLGIPTASKIVEWLGAPAPRWSQEQINGRLVEHARAGRTVVRLKGGDPFVFGRGDAEIECLAEHGIPWEVIPGCSSATAVLAAAGFPLTRHGEGRSFAVATARIAGGGVLGAFPTSDSLVIMMGIAVLDQIVARLLAQGWRPETPAAVIERGTLPWERRVRGPLAQLHQLAVDAGVGPPALVVVGRAAAPISACRKRPAIVFTGRDPAPLRDFGDLLHWPALEDGPDGQADRVHPELGRPLPEHDVICFTHPAGVRAYWETYGPAAFRREVWCTDARARELLIRYGIASRWVISPADRRAAEDARRALPLRAAS